MMWFWITWDWKKDEVGSASYVWSTKNSALPYYLLVSRSGALYRIYMLLAFLKKSVDSKTQQFLWIVMSKSMNFINAAITVPRVLALRTHENN